MPQYSTKQYPKGLFRILKWAVHAVSCQRAHAGGRGPRWSGAHPTQRVSHGVMARASHGVCPACEVGPKRTASSGWSQASSVRSRTVRTCVPSQAQAVTRRSSRTHRAPAVGANGRDASAMRTRPPRPTPWSAHGRGPRRGYKRDTPVRRMEQRGALLLQLDRISPSMLRGDGERHRVDVVVGDAGHPAPTAEVQHCLPADPGRLGLGDAGQHRCHRMAWQNNTPLIWFRFCLH